jgi:porphobilinogen deaminase
MNLDILYLEVESNEAESVVALLHKEEHTVSYHLARALMKAMDEGCSQFIFAEISFPDGMSVKLGCSSEDYESALRKQQEILEQYEEYEVCEKLNKYIKTFE